MEKPVRPSSSFRSSASATSGRSNWVNGDDGTERPVAADEIFARCIFSQSGLTSAATRFWGRLYLSNSVQFRRRLFVSVQTVGDDLQEHRARERYGKKAGANNRRIAFADFGAEAAGKNHLQSWFQSLKFPGQLESGAAVGEQHVGQQQVDQARELFPRFQRLGC